MSRRIDHDGRGSLLLRFSYDRDLVDLVKTLPGRRWNPEGRFWSVPDADVVRVVELLAPHGFLCDEGTRALFDGLGGAGTLDEGPNHGTDDYRISRLNREVRSAIEAVFPASVWVVGEISGFDKNSHRRHVGFQLVERDADGREEARVQAILFDGVRRLMDERLEAAGNPFRLGDEIEVRLRARVELYEPWGQYRIRIEDLDVSYTLGEAARRREEIVRRLTAEGLAGRNAALSLPVAPLRVGLVTSLHSDAYNDVLRTLQESGFAFRVAAHGARVQGRSTEPSVLNALDFFRDRADDFDVVLLCRGGGSRTDLAWFDSEPLGRAVATFPLPVVVGIGHEQDTSVLDSCGRSAKTPTAAASLLVERVEESYRRTEDTGRSILEAAAIIVREERAALLERSGRLVRASTHRVERETTDLGRRCRDLARFATALIAGRKVEVDRAARQAVQGARRDLGAANRRVSEVVAALRPRSRRLLDLEQERSVSRERRLHLVHPRRVVERGYAILRGENRKVLTRASMAPAGTRVRAEIRDGRLVLRSEGAEEDRD